MTAATQGTVSTMKPRLDSFNLRGQLSLERFGRNLLGGYRVALLESIDRHGTLTHAAKEVGVSYKTAWDAVDAMNNLAEEPLVVRAPGGHHGGGSYLTDYGRQSIRLYRMVEAGYQRVLARVGAEIHDLDRLGNFLRAIAMRTSARNQLRGSVKAIRRGAINADVLLDIGDDLDICANITNESVDDLALAPGREAFALIKASFIILAVGSHLRVSARNRLPGTVTEVIDGPVSSEVKIQLAGCRTLTALITRESAQELDLVEGTSCCALIKASHVLIAVND
jgi:molybdate transport system regulatory protein